MEISDNSLSISRLESCGSNFKCRRGRDFVKDGGFLFVGLFFFMVFLLLELLPGDTVVHGLSLLVVFFGFFDAAAGILISGLLSTAPKSPNHSFSRTDGKDMRDRRASSGLAAYSLGTNLLLDTILERAISDCFGCELKGATALE